MKFPLFHDTDYKSAVRVLATDRLIDRIFLWALPRTITPNHVTLCRILLTIPTVILLAFHQYAWGVPLFMIAALSDAIDGAMARTRNMITTWGMMFDPFADKLLIISSVLILLSTHVSKILVSAVVGVELLTIVLALLWRRQGRVVQADIWGKIKMILQVAGIFCILLVAWLHLPLLSLAWVLLWISVGCACIGIIRRSI